MSRTGKSLIVVGIDGSPGSLVALDWAAAEAQRSAARLELLYAEVPLPPAVGVDPPRAAPLPTEPLPDFLAEARRRVGATWPEVAVGVVAAVGSPAACLISTSADADLVVVGAHGRSMVARLLLGSVSHHVATRAACTSVVVRGTEHGAAAPVAVGIDDSPTARAALEVAFDQAAGRGVPLVVFHAWQDLPATGYGLWGTPPGLTDEMRAEAQALVTSTLQGWPEKYPDVEVHTRVEHSHPVTAVVEESSHAQLVVLGAHGRGRFAGMEFGSVPSAAVRESLCPVMVVRPPQDELPR